VPTDEASEFKAVPVAAIHVTTARASSAGILGRNQLKCDSLGCGLVLHKELSHSIRPAMHLVAKDSSFVNTGFADVSQIFHDYSLCSLLNRPAYKLFRRTMQHVLGYGCFIARHTLQQPMRGSGANRLYFGPNLTDTSPAMVQGTTAQSQRFTVIGVGSSKDSLNSRVNANHTAGSLGLWKLDGISKNKIPNLVTLFQLGVAPLIHWWHSLISNFNWLAPEADTLSSGVGKVPSPNHRHNFSSELNFMPLFLRLLRLVGGRQVVENRTRKLGRKLEFTTNFCIILFLKTSRTCIFSFKNKWRDVIAGSKELVAELVELLRLSNFNFNSSYCFHYIVLYISFSENPSFLSKYFLKPNKRRMRVALNP
jgi:hypothetical protein